MAIENDGDIKNGSGGTRFANPSDSKPVDNSTIATHGAHFKNSDDNNQSAENTGNVSVVGAVSLADMSSVPTIKPSDGDGHDVLDIPAEIEMAAYDRSQVVAERRDEKRKEHVIDKYRNGTRFMEYTKSALLLLLAMNTFAKMTSIMAILSTTADIEAIGGIVGRLAVTYVMYAVIMKLAQVLMAKRLKKNFDSLVIEEQNVIRYEYARDNARLTNDHVVSSIKRSLIIIPLSIFVCICMWFLEPVFDITAMSLVGLQVILLVCVLIQGRGHVNIDDGTHGRILSKAPKLRRGKMKLNPMDAIDTELESVMPKETVEAAHKVAEAVADDDTDTVIIPDVQGSIAIAEALSNDDTTNVVVVKADDVDTVEAKLNDTDNDAEADKIIDAAVADKKKSDANDKSKNDKPTHTYSKRLGKYVNRKLALILLGLSYGTIAVSTFIAAGAYFITDAVSAYTLVVLAAATLVSIIIASITAFIYRRCGTDYAHAPLFFLVYGLSNGILGAFVMSILTTCMCFGYPITATFAMFVIAFGVATIWNETSNHVGLDMSRPTEEALKAEIKRREDAEEKQQADEKENNK